MGISLMCCRPIAAACTLIQAQRPDAHLLPDFFQPTVNLRLSWPAIKIKCAVQLLPNCSTIAPYFKMKVQKNTIVLSLEGRAHNACDLKRQISKAGAHSYGSKK